MNSSKVSTQAMILKGMYSNETIGLTSMEARQFSPCVYLNISTPLTYGWHGLQLVVLNLQFPCQKLESRANVCGEEIDSNSMGLVKNVRAKNPIFCRTVFI